MLLVSLGADGVFISDDAVICWVQSVSLVKTYFFTLRTHDRRHALQPEGRRAEQAVGVSVPARRLLDGVQATGEAPADMMSRASAGPSPVTTELLEGLRLTGSSAAPWPPSWRPGPGRR